MSIYVGTQTGGLQLISSNLTKKRIEAIIKSEFMPKIGAVKYLARTTLIPIDINSTTFTGWVYANGGAYSKSDFPSANSIFAGKYGSTATTFNVPDLRQFVYPKAENASPTQINADACIPRHYHGVNTTIRYTADHVLKGAFVVGQSGTDHPVIGKLDENYYPKSGQVPKPVRLTPEVYDSYCNNIPPYNEYVPVFHGGGDKVSNKDHQVTTDLVIDLGVTMGVLGTGNSGNEPLDAYPAHMTMQVMVFIGKKGS